ncbi:hypothetical protein EHI8A_173450 [Entamoeba histolytica HM-1:IMSS-B]|uniref:Uncharacterized protein n=8 Tax=Entamoeba TaxID=5758 RepID=B1N3K4_ENTH1|nr:hypothetical protein EHI_017660 [Entamoeba histolytica HM-1:IMSS]XP_008856072.1 hypothetical protein ENU1_050710 [Entamoeba nuttalli P19]EMD43525.1 ataxia telangiectasia mutated, putative [Entamoeba histolytica KU27]EMH74669.1 hypothetical protein EHI8A_173450 [Entamoeba histolytica HM-1:IMSS-B]EMS16360.1 ataxia telangiectasia mutated, putative [Entamoeba histolytica HM-3:IMSS]ENY60088.1 ataxia telangiectasia mutated, putative [Entamoeba histolytica HM-1:IMSS-A]GAT95853.1 hypothetical prot|eukprot:XP_008856072.1 hypothetical protein ENU1_050710 [Entamoeba nuttalli P19]
MSSMTVFEPTTPWKYEVIFGPSNDFLYKKNPSVKVKNPSPPNSSGKKTKKYWSFEQKMFAVEKVRLIGLTKAARFLQVTEPETYGDLSPSTLQYWIKQTKRSQ